MNNTYQKVFTDKLDSLQLTVFEQWLELRNYTYSIYKLPQHTYYSIKDMSKQHAQNINNRIKEIGART